MTDKEIEEEIFKALVSGDAKLVPASELGYDEEYIISQNIEKINDALYESYCAMCHAIEEMPDKSIESYLPVESLDENYLSCTGQYGMLKWYSMSIFFDKRLHTIDNEKQLYNEHHDDTAGDDLLDGPSEHLAIAINNTPELINILRNPFVIYCSTLFGEDEYIYIENQMNLETSLKNFVGNDIFSDTLLKYSDNNEIIITNKETIKSKDVVIPFLICCQKSLQILAKASKVIMENGANTVVLIFATRLVPSKDGREVMDLPSGHTIASFGPRFTINL